MSITATLMLKGQHQIVKTVKVNRASKNPSSHHVVVLLMEKMMDHKVMVEDRGVKGLMRLHQVKRLEVVERTMKDP